MRTLNIGMGQLVKEIPEVESKIVGRAATTLADS